MAKMMLKIIVNKVIKAIVMMRVRIRMNKMMKVIVIMVIIKVHKYNSNDGIEYEGEDDGTEYYMYYMY